MSFSPYRRYSQEINARNISYMAVLDFLKMPRSLRLPDLRRKSYYPTGS